MATGRAAIETEWRGNERKKEICVCALDSTPRLTNVRFGNSWEIFVDKFEYVWIPSHSTALAFAVSAFMPFNGTWALAHSGHCESERCQCEWFAIYLHSFLVMVIAWNRKRERGRISVGWMLFRSTTCPTSFRRSFASQFHLPLKFTFYSNFHRFYLALDMTCFGRKGNNPLLVFLFHPCFVRPEMKSATECIWSVSD